MSKYTTELRFICESLAGLSESEGYNSIDSIIDNSWDKVFSFDFPIFDENYRKMLCTNIIKYYYTREICAETYGRWKLFLESKLTLVMKKYNPLYKALLHEFNPLYDSDYYRTYTKSNEGEQENDGTTTINTNSSETSENNTSTETNATTNANSLAKVQDTPQGYIASLENNTYLSNASINESGTTSESGSAATASTTATGTGSETGRAQNTININNMEEYTEHFYGKNGQHTYPEIISDFKQNMQSVDEMVISELSGLFMGIY